MDNEVMDNKVMDNKVMDNKVMDNEVVDNEEKGVYTRIESKYYNYKAKEDLNLYFDEDITAFNNVYISAYNVNVSSLEPFLNFFLIKPKTCNKLQFPEVHIFKHFESIELINYSKIFLFGLLKLNEFEKFIDTLIFNGFYKFENNLYLFFDITKCSIQLNNIYSNSTTWFALIDEIVNYKKLCNLKIEENVSDLFISNDKLCFLTDIDDNSYEIPVVSFIGTSNEKVKFKYVFGESSQNNNAILGPYFYFTNFNNAFTCKTADFKENKENKENKFNECIIRFALFTGKVKYIENNLNDTNDDSEIKKQRLEDEKNDQNIERLTMRITDHNGLWSREYDSVYLGQTELDNGILMKNTPIIVVKKYEQQCPLSYHYINKKTLDKEKHDYDIL
jgi:hypothetical protein